MSESLETVLSDFRARLDQGICQIGEFDDIKVLRHESLGQWVAILRECNDNQKWRIQRFDKDGFIGHEVYGTKDIAIKTAARERFCICDDDALDRLEGTTAFRLGNAISTERESLNASMITFKEFLARVLQLNQEYSVC